LTRTTSQCWNRASRNRDHGERRKGEQTTEEKVSKECDNDIAVKKKPDHVNEPLVIGLAPRRAATDGDYDEITTKRSGTRTPFHWQVRVR